MADQRANHERTNGEEKRVVVNIEDSDLQDGVKLCAKSLIGRILTNKPINKGSMEAAFNNIWGQPACFKIEEIKPKIYQFFFNNEKDLSRILNGGLWLFRNVWLILQQWDRALKYHEEELNTVKLWIQIWGLSPHFRTIAVARKIAEKVGRVLDVDLFTSKTNQGSFFKAQIEWNVKKPLIEGVHVNNEREGAAWAEIKYERMTMFYYFCGLMGHEEDHCKEKAEGNSESKNFGPWLKALQVGQRCSNTGKHEERPQNNTEIRGRIETQIADVTKSLANVTMRQTEETWLNINSERCKGPDTTRVLQNNEKILLKENNVVFNQDPEETEMGKGKGLLKEISLVEVANTEERGRALGEDKRE